MTENSQWQPPGGQAGKPAPRYGEFVAPGSQPEVAADSRSGQQPGTPGWTPPPKPGLIPLRPLTLGVLLGASFQVLRRNPRPTFGFSLLLNGLVGVVGLVVIGLVSVIALSRTFTASAEDVDQLTAGAIAAIILSVMVPLALSIVTTAILQGIISLEVARGTVGEKLRLGGLWRQAKGRIGALVGWSMLLVSAVLLLIVVLALVIGLIIAFGGTAGLVIGILLSIATLGGLVVLMAWIGTRVSLVPSVLMLERLPLRAAVVRSWSLTVGYFWRTFGIQLLVAMILGFVSQIVSTPLSIIFSLGSVLLNPNGENSSLIAAGIVAYLLFILVTLVVAAITAIVQSAAAALIYIDLRMRKEGLDLELTRFVEARQAGDTSIVDPYLVDPKGTAPKGTDQKGTAQQAAPGSAVPQPGQPNQPSDPNQPNDSP